MYNMLFPEQEIPFNDVYYTCYMLEYIARKRKLQNFEVLSYIPKEALYRLISCAEVYHCENPEKISDEWIEKFTIPTGDFHYDNVKPELNVHIPSETRIGKVFAKLIWAITKDTPDDDLLGTFYNVYNSFLAKKINDYNCSAFYEPPYVQIKAYYDGHF